MNTRRSKWFLKLYVLDEGTQKTPGMLPTQDLARHWHPLPNPGALGSVLLVEGYVSARRMTEAIDSESPLEEYEVREEGFTQELRAYPWAPP